MKDPIVRIVTMTFLEKELSSFERLFKERSGAIRDSPGCLELHLLRDVENPTVMTTFSVWTSKEALDAYRSTELFKETWSVARKKFAAPPVATSYRLVDSLW